MIASDMELIVYAPSNTPLWFNRTRRNLQRIQQWALVLCPVGNHKYFELYV